MKPWTSLPFALGNAGVKQASIRKVSGYSRMARRAASWRALHRNGNSLFDPFGDEEVRFTRLRVVSVRSPNELSAVRAEHRKAVEFRIRRDLLESCAIQAHYE